MSEQGPTRELILLSPYRIPAQNASYLGNEDMASFLNAVSALWHPAVLRHAATAPHVASPYDHEQPTAGHIYAVPETPPLVLPDDWEQRVRDAGAVAFKATPDRAVTLANLKEALTARGLDPETERLFNLDADTVGTFFAVGFGFTMLDALFEAMEHENLIAKVDFWLDIQSAIEAILNPPAEAPPPPPPESPPEDPERLESQPPAEENVPTEPWKRRLYDGVKRLAQARDVLYTAKIHIVDLCLLEDGNLAEALPSAFDRGIPLNVVASGATLEKLAREQPERMTALKDRVTAEQVEVCGGVYLEREDALLPVESQLWNLHKGLAVSRDLLGRSITVFGRRRFGAHPQLPLLLHSVGLRRALLLPFDESSVLPSYRATVVNWPSPDGKAVEAFTRAPNAADSPQTFFHAAHYLHRTIQQDHAATLVLLHTGKQAAPWYEDWVRLSQFFPVLGQWTTLSRYIGDVMAGEYASAGSADDFHGDYLSERTATKSEHPVSWCAAQMRWRRRLDTAWGLAALQRGLAGKNDTLSLEGRLAELEDRIESAGDALAKDPAELNRDLEAVQNEAAQALADRLLSRATSDTPGYLVLNPCSFKRRVAVEIDGITSPIPLVEPVKACQIDATGAKLVVEVPAFGFAWFPKTGTGNAPTASRMKLADPSCVRNEFFEAEVDPHTGGLKAIRDHKTRINRLGQQLVFNPGNRVKVSSVRPTSTGPAYGEIVSEGTLLGEQDQVLCHFRQRFRAWLGRPLLEMRIEITPEMQVEGYPWHAYFGARFAWRDERALMLRGVNGLGLVTSHTRPESAEYIELRYGGQVRTTIFPGGLPFHQRHGGRMLDVILVPEGEKTQTFDLAIGLDREYPMQTSLGVTSPAVVVPTAKGPPHVGTTGWLFHLDAPNLALLTFRPAGPGADAVLLRLQENTGHSMGAEFRCVRDPRKAIMLDAQGDTQQELYIHGDGVTLDVPSGDLAHVRVEF